jgi:hypothetical protein
VSRRDGRRGGSPRQSRIPAQNRVPSPSSCSACEKRSVSGTDTGGTQNLCSERPSRCNVQSENFTLEKLTHATQHRAQRPGIVECTKRDLVSWQVSPFSLEGFSWAGPRPLALSASLWTESFAADLTCTGRPTQVTTWCCCCRIPLESALIQRLLCSWWGRHRIRSTCLRSRFGRPPSSTTAATSVD